MEGHDRTDRTTASAEGRLILLDQHRGRPRRGPLEKTRILVAEPKRLYAEALMFTLAASPDLEPIGYALDGWEALELTGSLEPDAIVVGAGLGGLDTLTFTQLVQVFWPETRLILLADTETVHHTADAKALGGRGKKAELDA